MRFRPGSVIIPPWKPLITYYDTIIERFRALQHLQHEQNASKSAEKEQHPPSVKEKSSQGSSGEKPLDSKETDVRKESAESEAGLEPCKVCELLYPPHDTPMECLDVRISHMQCLIDFLTIDLKHVFDLRGDLAAGTIQEISFEDLWHLFNPGDLIVSPKRQQAYRVVHTSGGRQLLSKALNYEMRRVFTAFRIDCFYIDFDQTALGPVCEVIEIMEYSGKRPITSLNPEFRYFGGEPIFPARYLENPDSFIHNLVERGRRLHSFGSFAHKRYHGLAAVRQGITTYEYANFADRGVGRLEQGRRTIENTDLITGDIIIDHGKEGKVVDFSQVEIRIDPRETAEGCEHYGLAHFAPAREIMYRVDCQCSDIVPDEVIDKARARMYKNNVPLLAIKDPIDALTDEHYMLLPSTVRAFVLQERLFMNLSVNLIKDLDSELENDLDILKRKSGLDQLVLPEGACDLLESLIIAQPSTALPVAFGTPVERGLLKPSSSKGQGVVILLHGGPGLGKTSTVEAIAAYTRRPLYSLSLDIPDDVRNTQRYLEDHLSYAQHWNCIVLIDDVDSELLRSSADYQRKGFLTSVESNLCHLMDLHRGIMILTAKGRNFASQQVLSRVNVSLNFPPFTEEANLKLWGMNIDLVGEHQMAIFDWQSRQDILQFVKQKYGKGVRWDGRQIRNCFQTAISLAKCSTMKGNLHRKDADEELRNLEYTPHLTSKDLERAMAAMNY